jgi:A/G-specific adenine glycosylase
MNRVQKFQKIVLSYYTTHGRKLPWRFKEAISARGGHAYKIFVSELMLQQTQVDRVIPKYAQFLKTFPNWNALARAPQKKVLRAWQGLGYNRRALFVRRAAQTVVQKYGGALPRDFSALASLPGVGPYTAGALLAFIWNEPMVFIETNIRAVFLHHFFPQKAGRLPAQKITDAELLPLITETLDLKNPRVWYWALMDYGAYLKKTLPNPSRRSAHHARHTPFAGSQRQLRGAIVRALAARPESERALVRRTHRTLSDVRAALSALSTEGFIRKTKTRYTLK